MKAKPIIKWVGGKTQLLDEINNNLPNNLDKIETYMEPFIGGGAVLFDIVPKLTNIKHVLINDLNYKLTNLYNVVKNNHEELIRKLNEIQKQYRLSDNPKEFYYNIRKSFNTYKKDINLSLLPISITDLNVLNASEFIFLNKTCFNGLYRENSKGEFNVPWNGNTKVCICDEENIKAVHDFFIKYNVEIFNNPYNVFFTAKREYTYKLQTFIYMDPPYRPITKSSAFTAYTKSGFNDKAQRDLKIWYDVYNSSCAHILLSNSDPKNYDPNDNFFDDLYSDYNIIRVNAKRSINSKGNGRGEITEILVKNY